VAFWVRNAGRQITNGGGRYERFVRRRSTWRLSPLLDGAQSAAPVAVIDERSRGSRGFRSGVLSGRPRQSVGGLSAHGT